MGLSDPALIPGVTHLFIIGSALLVFPRTTGLSAGFVARYSMLIALGSYGLASSLHHAIFPGSALMQIPLWLSLACLGLGSWILIMGSTYGEHFPERGRL
jgi:xanthine/uracil permease